MKKTILLITLLVSVYLNAQTTPIPAAPFQDGIRIRHAQEVQTALYVPIMDVANSKTVRDYIDVEKLGCKGIEETFTATAGQTVFTLTAPTNIVQVFKDRIIQIGGVDYNHTSGVVTFITPLNAGDNVVIYSNCIIGASSGGTSTDDQSLTFVSPNLSIEDGNTVDLSALYSPWDNPDATPANQTSGSINYMDGNVGVGTNNPIEKISVLGSLELQNNGKLIQSANTSGGRNTDVKRYAAAALFGNNIKFITDITAQGSTSWTIDFHIKSTGSSVAQQDKLVIHTNNAGNQASASYDAVYSSTPAQDIFVGVESGKIVVYWKMGDLGFYGGDVIIDMHTRVGLGVQINTLNPSIISQNTPFTMQGNEVKASIKNDFKNVDTEGTIDATGNLFLKYNLTDGQDNSHFSNYLTSNTYLSYDQVTVNSNTNNRIGAGLSQVINNADTFNGQLVGTYGLSQNKGSVQVSSMVGSLNIAENDGLANVDLLIGSESRIRNSTNGTVDFAKGFFAQAVQDNSNTISEYIGFALGDISTLDVGKKWFFGNDNADVPAYTFGSLGVGIKNPTEKIDVNGNVKATGFKLAGLQTAPASSTATGTVGEIRITATHIYWCIATNTWIRSLGTTF